MSRLTTKGQVTIPKPVRDRLGVGPGDAVTFELDKDGRVIVRKDRGKVKPSRFAALRGRAGKGPSTAQIMTLTRGDK